MKSFRKLFGDYLASNDITQSEASTVIGVSQQAVSTLLNSDTEVRPSTKTKVFNAYPEFQKMYELVDEASDRDRALRDFHPLEIMDYIIANRDKFVSYDSFYYLIQTFMNDKKMKELSAKRGKENGDLIDSANGSED